MGRSLARRVPWIRWRGCYGAGEGAARHIRREGDACIVNTHTRLEGGRHWVALVGGRNGPLYYDSFGRALPMLSQHFRGAAWDLATGSEPTAEQGLPEVNCGARCLAWLACCGLYGPEETALVL